MPYLPLWLVIGSTAIDGVVAGLALFLARTRRGTDRTPPIGVGRLLVATGATSAGFLVKAKILQRFGLHLFGWIHLAYIDLVILVPAIGLTLLAAHSWAPEGRSWRTSTKAVRLGALASPILALIGFHATWIEPFRLQVESARLAVPGREGKATVRIGVLTDLQTDGVAGHERRAVDLLMEQDPDLILLPGDVFQGTAEQFGATRSALVDLLGRLKAPGGVYLVLGDTDGTGEHLRKVLDLAGIRLLVNDVARVSVGGRRLAIGGVELNHGGAPAREVIRRLEAEGDQGEVRILLAHRPDVALGLRPGSRVDLVVAWHTHGGQVVVPWFGPPVVLSAVPRVVAAGGLHQIAGNPIYVSRGVGSERGQAPRIRFLCPPEVSLILLGSDSAH